MSPAVASISWLFLSSSFQYIPVMLFIREWSLGIGEGLAVFSDGRQPQLQRQSFQSCSTQKEEGQNIRGAARKKRSPAGCRVHSHKRNRRCLEQQPQSVSKIYCRRTTEQQQAGAVHQHKPEWTAKRTCLAPLYPASQHPALQAHEVFVPLNHRGRSLRETPCGQALCLLYTKLLVS